MDLVNDLLPSCLRMHSKGMVVVLSVPKLVCSKFIRSTNNISYLKHNKGVIICGIFSETAPLQRSSTPSVEWPYV